MKKETIYYGGFNLENIMIQTMRFVKRELRIVLILFSIIMIYRTLILQVYILKDFILQEGIGDDLSIEDIRKWEWRLFIIAGLPMLAFCFSSIVIKEKLKLKWSSMVVYILITLVLYREIYRKLLVFFSVTSFNVINSLLSLLFFTTCLYYIGNALLKEENTIS